MQKTRVGIIGTGNIGCDLLMKVKKSRHLECTLFMGRNINSSGMQFAAKQGINVSDKSISALSENPGLCDIVFDATTAAMHKGHAEILNKLGKYTIDLTPSLIGKMCLPTVNGEECLNVPNINMLTCGAQATVPIVNAISKAQAGISYIEIVATISSKSAGPGTRANIDEFTQTTKNSLALFSGVEKTKAVILLNPANPPVMMHNTIYLLVDNPDLDKIARAAKEAETAIKKYVPGYAITLGPVIENGHVTLMVSVIGAGDFLPPYAGNLDIITCAAIDMAEKYAAKRLK